jgi:drug/metabolite transporter (DMT)-like permease
MSVLGPFSFFYLVSTSFEIIPTSEGLMLSFTWPLIMVIFSFPILKEKLTLRKIGAILVSLFGVILIITKGQSINIFTNLYGDLLALAGGISWALYSVLCKKFKYHSISNQFVFRLFALIYTIVLIPFFSNFFIPSIYQLMGFMWIGIFNMGIAVVLWFKALEMGDTAKIANITYLIPFISLVWIFLVLKEQIQLISVVGLILVILGVLIQD